MGGSALMREEMRAEALLLQGSSFRRLFESRIAGQIATNAMIYALLILLVEDDGSSFQATLFVIALTLPAVILAIPGGTVADFLPRRLTMLVAYLTRAAIAVALIYYGGNFIYIYLLVLAHSAIGQLFGPAEAAVVPAVVPRQRLPAANALMTLGLIIGQIAGMVVLAPVLIKVLSPDAVFAASAALFLLGAWIVLLARGFTARVEEAAPAMGFVEATRHGFEILRTSRTAYLAIVYLVTSATLSKVLVILLPEYTRTVLDIEPEDAVFVAMPAALGAALALLIVPLMSRLLGAWRVAAFGFVLLLLGLFGLGFVVYLRDAILDNVDLGIAFIEDEVGVSSVITVTMLLAIPLGFAFTLVSVASRVVMNEQAPPEAQGRVFAVQVAVGDLLSLAPLLVVGAASDAFGVRVTLIMATAAAAIVSAYLTFGRKFGQGPPSQRVEASGPIEPGLGS